MRYPFVHQPLGAVRRFLLLLIQQGHGFHDDRLEDLGPGCEIFQRTQQPPLKIIQDDRIGHRIAPAREQLPPIQLSFFRADFTRRSVNASLRSMLYPVPAITPVRLENSNG